MPDTPAPVPRHAEADAPTSQLPWWGENFVLEVIAPGEETELIPVAQTAYRVPPPVPAEALDSRYLPIGREHLSPAIPDPAPGYRLWYDYGHHRHENWSFRVAPAGVTPGPKGMHFSLSGVVWEEGDGNRVKRYAQALGLVPWGIRSAPMALTPLAVEGWSRFLRMETVLDGGLHTGLVGAELRDLLGACRTLSVAMKLPSAALVGTPYPVGHEVALAELAAHLDGFDRAGHPAPASADSPAAATTRGEESEPLTPTLVADAAAVLGRTPARPMYGKLIRALLTPRGPGPKREVSQLKREVYGKSAMHKSESAFRRVVCDANIHLSKLTSGSLRIEAAGRGWRAMIARPVAPPAARGGAEVGDAKREVSA